MWNLQQVLDLEKWKKDNDDNVQLWFDTLAEFEALHSFATLHFNHTAYCFPILKENHFTITATELGHPLIHQNKRINNFINIETAGEIMLVTGSNMAGKSTYLRSIGINVILTMAGAPVCAKSFALSPVQLLSSMRIADNLEESTSTFYAELKKLKTVIEKINAGEKVFVLLDEILRGTNSLDRHTGSEALIRQFIKQKAAAILATHDVALATLEKEYPKNILNFHFDAQTKGEELFFDYKLKDGVCTNMNASLLMKKIGLEI
jgi:DNA mismatch repair ATPase MutS